MGSQRRVQWSPFELIRWSEVRAIPDGSITQEIYTAENEVAGFGS